MPPAPRRSLIPILRRRNERGEAEASLLLFPRGIPFEGTPDGGWTGGASGDTVGAVINRPGDSAPAGGRFRGGCAPHSLFVLDKKRMRRARWKRKNRFNALRCSGPPRATGVGVSVPAPILPCLRARYNLLRFLQLLSRASTADVDGVVVVWTSFSFRCRWLFFTGA